MGASVDLLPPDLRPLGRRVPSETRANQTQMELEARCTEAAALLAQADSEPYEDRSRRKKRQAERVLAAMSLSAFTSEQSRLLDEISQAKLEQADYRALALHGELTKLVRTHPQPLETLAGMLTEMAANRLEENITQAAAGKRRWFRPARKSGESSGRP
jgi:hypothetical protein